jgi:hydroxyacylglutathione hydrolase
MENILQYTGGLAQTNGYLYERGDRYWLIDAPEGICGWIAGEGVSIAGLLLTHQHFDHVIDVAEIAEAHGCPIYSYSGHDPQLTLEALFAGGLAGLTLGIRPFEADHLLREGGQELADIGVEILHVPGHSSDSLCFYVPEEGLVFCGDTLFAGGGRGRTDFPGGSEPELVNGVKAKLLVLPGETVAYPGHGPQTQLWRERAWW